MTPLPPQAPPIDGTALHERIEACHQGGQLQVQLYAQLHHIDLEEARAILEQNKQRGRTPCSFLDAP